MTQTEPSVDELRAAMRRVRCDMDDEVEIFVASTRELMDWHYYLAKAPWLCLGGAALVGYLLIPTRTRWLRTSSDRAAKIEEERPLTADEMNSKRSTSSAGFALKLVAPLLWQAARKVALKQLERYLNRPRPERPYPPRPDTEATYHD